MIAGRHEIVALQNADSPISGAFTPARDLRQRRFSGLAKAARASSGNGPARREINMSGSASSRIGTGGAPSDLRKDRACAMLDAS
jgi:hypothetical protein